jgi:S-adenosylmethionine:tRNA-ribosyltransferase-isomerase (queuine synthetase)
MAPILRQEDLIGYSLTSSYEPGDVIVFNYKSKVVAHRLMEVHENTLVAKGDNYFQQDEFIRNTDVIGVAKYSLRGSKRKYLSLCSKKANRFMLRYSISEVKIGDFMEKKFRIKGMRKLCKMLSLPYYIVSYWLFLLYAKHQ